LLLRVLYRYLAAALPLPMAPKNSLLFCHFGGELKVSSNEKATLPEWLKRVYYLLKD